MTRESTTDTLYLRLPARSTTLSTPHNSPLSLAVAMRGRTLRSAVGTLTELAPQLTQVSEVVLLLAASDVTLLRMPVPPLTAVRLQAALPSLVEERVIGDTADCVIAAAPETDGQRLIALVDRGWLEQWVDALRTLGARRIRALPMALCLPEPVAAFSAALLKNSNQYELAVRLSAHEGLGLPVEVDDETQLPAAVAQLLATVAPQRPVELSVPAAHSEWFHTWFEAQQVSRVKLVEQQWSDWITASARVPVDLMTAMGGHQRSSISLREWRWPIALAGTLAFLNIIALNADWWRLRSEGLQLRDDITGIYQRSFPNDKVVLDPLAQMKQKLALARQASGQLSHSDYVVLSAALGEAWREAGNDMRAIATLDYAEGKLNIKLKQGVQVSLEAMRAPLATRQLQLTPSPADPLLLQVRHL